ncbi:MAG: SH3 domain-containing protein [Candidatus Promineifilaceae bacterium]|nr:SH3 domain-containing protein [Candidatus Promineifilaceae bacterium]
MEENETNDNSSTRNWLIIGGIILIIVLLIAGLFLPPISLGQRLGFGAEPVEQASSDSETRNEEVDASTTAVVLPDGLALSLSEGTAEIAVASQDVFLAASSDAAPPAQLTMVSDVYTVSSESSPPYGQIALPIQAGAGDHRTLDLYGWDGIEWVFMPSQIDANSEQMISAEQELPQAMVMMQVGAPESAAVGAEVTSGETLPAQVSPLLTEITINELVLQSDGAVLGEPLSTPDGGIEQWLRVTNVGPVTDQAALTALLADPAAQQAHIDLLVQKAEAGFSGINLDYQAVPANLADEFTSFVESLADGLHEKGLKLLVTLGAPTLADNSWDSGGQDWMAIGETADVVYLQMPSDPSQYDIDDNATQIIEWATRQIDRRKLSALNNAAAVDRIGETFIALSNEEALTNFGELQFLQGAEEVGLNETVEVALSGSANPLEWDGSSLTYKYSYEDDGQSHEVWLGSESALSHRLRQGGDYNLRGVSVQGLENMADGTGYAAAIDSYRGTAEAPQPTAAAIVWTVRNENDSVLASESGNELTFSWEVGDAEGNYTVSADFALGENIANLDSLQVAVSATAEEEDTEVAEESEPEDTEAVDTANTGFTGDADAVVNVGANVRTGPGLTYGTLSDGADPGMELSLIGRNSDGSWLNVILPDGREGWIFAALVTVSSSVTVSDLPVIEVAAPAVAAAPEDSGSGDDGGQAPAPAAPPPPVAVAPVTNAGFELGGQSHSFGNPQLMSYAGMNWVKFQHKWGPGDDPSAVAGRIQQAHGNGFKVLLSIPGSPYPSSIDFNSYVQFLGGVAALGPDAIEVWNEMNIDFEWPVGQIDPANYVNNMLAPAYNAIKSANSNVMVISGAPAPTGYFGGGCSANGCDDSAFLAGMAAAGAANYMDCMGAHFNAGATPPAQASGHPAGNNHYSWYFQPMLDLYYGSLGKPVCFTELGYLSGEDFGGVPSRFSWAGGTTVGQHAQWLAEAVSLSANSGKARLAIIFNVDFTQWGDDPQAGYAMIRPDGSCPACETLRQVMGR